MQKGANIAIVETECKYGMSSRVFLLITNALNYLRPVFQLKNLYIFYENGIILVMNPIRNHRKISILSKLGAVYAYY